jgi:glycosyltransferase involved in cell wall biosynthesis
MFFSAMSFAVIIPTYGEWPYVFKCLETLVRYTSGYHCYVLDDCSPDWKPEYEAEIRRIVPAEHLHFERYAENRGLTAAWNHGLTLARDDGHEFAALVNSDTLFSPGWLLRTVEALAKADLIGPLTNAPSDSAHQDIRNYVRGYQLDDSHDALAELSDTLRRKYAGRQSAGTINGYWMAAKTATWWTNAFDATHVFDPKNRLTGNESEFEKRFRGKIAAYHDTFIFHYRSVSRGLEHVDAQYCKGAHRLPDGADARLNPSYVSRRSDLVSFIPKDVTRLLDIGCSVGAVGAHFKKERGGDAKVVGIEYDPQMAAIARGNLDAVFCGSAEDFPLEELADHAPFNGILFADVLEHLRNPREVLARFSTLLRPGGAVVTSLPNVRHHTVIWNLLRRGYWPGRDRGIHDRTHLRWFTRRNIEELFEFANFRIAGWHRCYRAGDRPTGTGEKWGARFAKGPLRELMTYQYYVLARK